MSEHILEKRYDLHRGLNPRKSDLTRPMQFASGMRNAQYTSDGSTEKRKGYQAAANSAGGYGDFLYNRVDPVTNAQSSKILTVDQNLYLLTDTTLAVTYSGASTSAQLNFFYDTVTAQYRFQMSEAGVNVLDFACGIGFDEASPIAISALRTAINAVTNFTAVVTGTSTTPAAFLSIVRSWDLLNDGAWTGTAKSWTQVNSTVTNPFSSYLATKNAANFQNVSGVVVNNVLYLSNGLNEVHKYDGQTFYRAGLPTPASTTTALGSSGLITGTNYHHLTQYQQIDAAGQTHEGNLYPQILTGTGLAPTTQQMDVTVANIQAGSGFNTNCAIVAGSQTTVTTVTVDNGSSGAHTLKVGDQAYFYDSVSTAYVTRTVTAVSSSTITISGAAVTVDDNAVISNNLKINIWRNKTSDITPSLFYLVAELPNNSFAATQVYSDNTVDASLGALLLAPVTDRSPPPKGKYLATHQNHLVVAGMPDAQLTVAWSDLDGPEYFPADTNQTNIQAPAGESLVGVGSDASILGLLTNNTTTVLSGTLGDNSIRLEQKASDIGCEAHASIIQVKGVLCWWSARGPYGMANGQIPTPLGVETDDSGNIVGRISPVMEQLGVATTQRWVTQRITAVNWTKSQKALWFIPTESTSLAGDHYPNDTSTIYAYDYDRDAWLAWDNVNMMGGALAVGSELYFHERRYSTYATAVKFIFYRFHNINDGWDYQDNNQPIEWEYDLGWESLGQPSVLKRFLEMTLFILEDIPNNDLVITVSQEMDYTRDAPVASFDLEFEAGGYGVGEYGTNPYGDPLNGRLRHDLKRERARSMRIRLANSQDQTNSLFTGIEFKIAAPYRREFKV